MANGFGRSLACIGMASMLLLGTFLVVAAGIVAADSEGDYTYTVSEGKATVTGYIGTGGAITIPTTLGGFPTVAIADSAFRSCSNLTSVTISENITSIGAYAFSNCTNLTSVIIPRNVTSIGTGAFQSCGNLTSINVAADNAYYSSIDGVLYDEAVDTLIQYPGGRIGPFIIPRNVTHIGDSAFYACANLTSVTIPGNVASIGNESFRNCTSLASVTFLGLVAPTTVGANWTIGTDAGIRGHAYAASDFPLPGNDFHGLTMGDVLVTAPGVPAGLVASPGNAWISLNWTAPTFNGGSDVTQYTVYRSLTEDGVYSLIASPSEPLYNDTGLTNGQTYWYNVSAVNSVGEGEKTAPVSSIPYTVPDAPTGLTALAGNAQISLNWTAPVEEGGSAITNYTIYRGTTPGGEMLNVTVGNVQSYVDEGLSNGQKYFYFVRAVNGAGEGVQSNEANTTPVGVPTAPVIISATPGDGQITLAWTAPTDDGGLEITNYRVYRGLLPGILIIHVTVGNVTTYIDAGLSNGLTYYYTVSAVNSLGEGPQSDEASATPRSVPSAPRGLRAVAGDSVVELNWTEPEYAGPGTLTYHLFRDGTEIWSGIGLTNSDTAVANGISYSYQVAADNSVGWGPNCTAVQATPLGVPSAPRGFEAVAGDGSIALTWTTPAYTGPGTLTYHLFRNGTLIWNGTATSYLDAPLTKNVSYSYNVAANNSIGWGPNTTVAIAAAVGVPDAPWGLAAGSGDASVSLSWNAVNYSGPGTLTYHLFRDGVEVWSGVGTSHDDVGLNNGQAYEYNVAATNSVGWSANSSSAVATPEGGPSSPTGLHAEAGNGYVQLNWSAPLYVGPGSIVYHLFRDDVLIWSGDLLEYNDTGVQNFVEYNYQLAAENALGWGPNSTTVSATPLPSEMMPTAPMNLVVVGGDRNVTLTWEEPAYSNASAVTGYRISYGTSADSMQGQITWQQLSYLLEGLDKGRTYYFKVAAQNEAGWGPNSTTASATPFGVPDAPRNLSASEGIEQVALAWDPPAYSGPGTLIYHLFRDGSLLWSGTATSFVDSPLVGGSVHTYNVAASNDIGWGANCSAIEATPVLPEQRPSAPLDPVAVAGNGNVTLSWDAPAYSNASSVEGYLISYGIAPGSMPNHFTWTQLIYVVGGLEKGQEYYFKVSALNSAGWGPNSSVVSATPFGAPSVPLELTAATGSVYVNLTWSAPSYAGPGALVFHLFRNGVLLWTGPSLAYNDTAVAMANTYSYKVAAQNDVGWGPNSSTALAVLPPVRPGTPTDLHAIVGDSQVTLTWSAPSQSGTSSITGYKVYRGTTPGSFTLIATVSGTTYVDADVMESPSYHYKVSAVSSAGEGTPTAEVVAVIIASAPNYIWTVIIGVVGVIVAVGAVLIYLRKK